MTKTTVGFNSAAYLLTSVYTIRLYVIFFLQTIGNSWSPELESDLIVAGTNSLYKCQVLIEKEVKKKVHSWIFTVLNNYCF